MNPILFREFPLWSIRFEGMVTWHYLDILGLVTTGVGNLLPNVQSSLVLPWHVLDANGDLGRLATRQEIADDYNRVRDAKYLAQAGHVAAGKVSKLRLTAEGVANLVANKMEQNHTHLLGRIPGLEDHPLDAQMATHSMAWACGPGFNFPALIARLQNQNFAEAVKECHIDTRGPDRVLNTRDDNYGVVPRNMANKVLYGNAAMVKEYGLDFGRLYYPKDLTDAKTLALFREEKMNEDNEPIVHEKSSSGDIRPATTSTGERLVDERALEAFVGEFR